MLRAVVVGLAAALLGCGSPTARVSGADPAGDVPTLFIAGTRDFQPFRSWPATDLGDEPNTADPPGPRVAFVSQRPAAGAYPVGSMIVKAIENDVSPQGWDLFAMAKRGGDYDFSGARGWEFFLLRLEDDQTIQILSRGSTLADPSDGGMIYGSVGAILCSGCHGAAGTERTDHVLSPLLAP